MSSKFRWTSLAYLVTAAAALGAFGTIGASAHSRLVPFSAELSGNAMFTSQATAEFSGAGRATHMGLITNLGEIVITGGPDQNGCLPNTNTEYLTAANGDLLILEMDDVACPIDATGFRFMGHGNWQVIGGTGRFAGATGSGTVVGFGNFVDGVFGITITGTIAGIGPSNGSGPKQARTTH